MSGPPSESRYGDDVFRSPGSGSRGEVVYNLKELRGIRSNEKEKEKEKETKAKHRGSKLFPFPLPSLHSNHHSKSTHSDDLSERHGERSSNSFDQEEYASMRSSTNGLRRSFSGKSSGRKSADLSRSGSNGSDRDRVIGRPTSFLNQSPVRRNVGPNSASGGGERSDPSRPLSLRSVDSSTHSTRTTSILDSSVILDPPQGGSIPKPTSGNIAGSTRRERRPEAREWNQICYVWTKEKSKDHINGSGTSGSGSGGGGVLGGLGSGLFSKSKSSFSSNVSSPSKRESAMLGFGGAGVGAGVDLTQNPSEEKKSGPAMEKGSYSVGPSSTTKEGSWKLVMGVLKDDGYLRIFGDVSSSSSRDRNQTFILIGANDTILDRKRKQ